MKYSNILSECRTVPDEEKEQAIELKKDDLCYLNDVEYIRCANPKDPDYKKIPNRNCSGRSYVSEKHWICSECSREITEPQSKQRYTEHVLQIDRGGVRDWVRKQIKEYFDTNANTVSRTYRGITNDYVLDILEPDVKLFLLFDNPGLEYLHWCRVYDENPAFVLIDNALPLENDVRDISIPNFTIDDFYPTVSKSIDHLQDAISDPLELRNQKASLAYELSKDDETRRAMSYDDFEQCVQRLLVGTIGNSQLLGSAESGSPVPDGTLTLHFEDDNHLYMWDGKFVKFNKGSDKTDLSDEYDKIFRHLMDMRKRPQVRENFTDIQGIILFSPGIEEATVNRLAEFIQEEILVQEDTWNGMVIYFQYDALCRMYNLYQENRYNVTKKERTFRAFLHAYLQSLDKHKNDPDMIRTSPNQSLHVGIEDIESIFSKLAEMEVEESEFNVAEHMTYVDVLR
jgi:hypothetical protein